MRRRSHDERIACNGRRCDESVVQMIVRHLFKFACRLENRDRTRFREAVNQSVCVKRRRPELAAKSLRPNLIARFGIQARSDSIVIHHEKQITEQEVLEDLAQLFPGERPKILFKTMMGWARYAELFSYDQRMALLKRFTKEYLGKPPASRVKPGDA